MVEGRRQPHGAGYRPKETTEGRLRQTFAASCCSRNIQDSHGVTLVQNAGHIALQRVKGSTISNATMLCEVNHTGYVIRVV
jgi:hypothetical protein